MKITSTYSVRLRNFNRVFDDTVEVYRRERQKFCVHGIIGARQSGASNEHEYQTQFS